MCKNRYRIAVAALALFLVENEGNSAWSSELATLWSHPLTNPNPTEQVDYTLSQDFNVWYKDAQGKEGPFYSFHLGEDYVTCSLNFNGTPLSECPEPAVFATASGVVQHARFINGYGHVVIIQHDLPDNDPAGRAVVSVYGHLSATDVIPEKDGLGNPTTVSRGDPIGVLSKRGCKVGSCGSVHLHFAVKKGAFVDEDNDVSKCWNYAGYSSLFTTTCFDEPNRIKNRSHARHYDVKSDWFDPSDFIAKRRTLVHQEALGLYVGSFSSGNLHQVEIAAGISDLAATGLGQSLEDLVVDSLGVIYIGGRITGVRRVDSVTGARLSDIAGNVVGPEGPSIDFYGDRDSTQGDLFLNTRLRPGVHTGIWRVQVDSGAVTGENVVESFSGWGEGTVFLTKGDFAGNLLAVDSTGGRVVRIVPPASAGLYGPPQTFIGGLSNPIGIAVNSEGNVFVTEFRGPIRRFNSAGKSGSIFVDGLGLPFFIEFDADDNLYVVENVSGSVRKYSPGGALIWQSPLEVVTNPNNEGPIGIGINY